SRVCTGRRDWLPRAAWRYAGDGRGHGSYRGVTIARRAVGSLRARVRGDVHLGARRLGDSGTSRARGRVTLGARLSSCAPGVESFVVSRSTWKLSFAPITPSSRPVSSNV